MNSSMIFPSMSNQLFKPYEEIARKFAEVTGSRPNVDEEVRYEESSFSTPDFNAPDITHSAPVSVPQAMKEELNNLTATAPTGSKDNHDYFDDLMNEMD